MEEKCRLCRFWRLIREGDKDIYAKGLCRRYPPQPDEDNHLESSQPYTLESDWCGEFQPREESL